MRQLLDALDLDVAVGFVGREGAVGGEFVCQSPGLVFVRGLDFAEEVIDGLELDTEQFLESWWCGMRLHDREEGSGGYRAGDGKDRIHCIVVGGE